MRNFIINPFFYYCFSFILVLLLYTLKWSDLYPSFSFGLSSFIFFTIVFSILMMLLFDKIIQVKKKVKIQPVEKIKVIYLFIFLLLSLIVECVYHGLIPLLLVAKGVDYDYTQFGIPVFHVFLLSYVTLLGTLYFYRFLIFKRKYYLLIFYFSIAFSLLIVNRGTLIFILLSAIIAYSSMNLNVSKIIKIISTVFFCYFYLWCTR